MAIVYKTSAHIAIEEVDPHDAPTAGLKLEKHFTAPYLRFKVRNRSTGVEEISSNAFAVYSVSRGGLHYAVIGSTSNDNQSSMDRSLRVFQVREDLLAGVVEQLSRNRGVLDSEYEIVHAVTDGFRYGMLIDPQKAQMYATEDQLPNANYQHIRVRNKADIAALNSRLGSKPMNAGYALNSSIAAELGDQIIDDYDLKKCRIELDPMHTNPTAAARCTAMGSRIKLFDRDMKLRVQMSPYLPIFRGIVCHEFAHALDAREFGCMSHGPTFVLLYAELLGRYTDLNFVNTYDFFVKSGLKVANPIHSELFGQFNRQRRAEFSQAARAVRKEHLGE